MAFRSFQNFGVPDIRQREIFDSFPSMNYMDEQQSEFDAVPPPMETTGPFDPRVMGQQAQIGQVPQLQDPEENIMDMINRGYTPDTIDRDRLRGHLDDIPVREEPGFMRRLAAAGALVGNRTRGIPGGWEAAQKVRYAPYLRDMMEWKEKTTPFHQAAELENRSNINERTLVSNAVQADTQAKRLGEQGRQADEKNATARLKIENDYKIQKITADIKEAIRTGGVKEVVNDGKRIIIVYNDGRQEDTGLDGLAMNRIEIANLNNAAAKLRADADNATRVQIAGMPSRSNVGDSGGTGTGTGTGTVTGGGRTNTLERMRVINEQLKADYQTDTYVKPYIRKLSEGQYTFTDRPVVGAKNPTTTTFGMGGTVYTQADADAYDDYRKSVDPTYVPPVSRSTTVAPARMGGPGPGTGATQGQTAPAPQAQASDKGVGLSKPFTPKPRSAGTLSQQLRQPAKGPTLGQILFPKTETTGNLAQQLGRNYKDPDAQAILEEKAVALLKSEGQPVNEENVRRTIAAGYVR